MTSVCFTRDADDLISSVEISGHAGYADEGEDIVCAAITSAIQLAHILLEDIHDLVIDTIVEQEGAYIRVSLPDDAREAGQDVMQALHMHYLEMQESYAEFIEVTEVYNHAED